MKIQLTDAQRRILKLFVALDRREPPDDAQTQDSSNKTVDWKPAYKRRTARASKNTSGMWPWNLTVHAATAEKLKTLGLLGVKYEPKYGSDGHGHWGGTTTWYFITDAGRNWSEECICGHARTQHKNGFCGATFVRDGARKDCLCKQFSEAK